MCPTCMKVIPIINLGEISEAHIVPKAAGGKIKTLICKECNSRFGAKQDRWFADFINIAHSSNPSPFSTGIKDKYFKIDGEKINGSWKLNPDGGFSFYIHDNLNPPQTIESIDKKFRNNPQEIELSAPLPIIKNQKLVSVGFLTAAYLMWFGLLGYSWAMQPHLDKIRKQIINPEKDTIPKKYLATVDSADWIPWIGLVTLSGDTVPAFGLTDKLVFLPPKDKPNFYESLRVSEFSVNLSDIKPLQLPTKPDYGPPLIIVFKNRLIVYASPANNSKKKSICIHFTDDSDKGRILRQIEEEDFNTLKKKKNVRCTHIDSSNI